MKHSVYFHTAQIMAELSDNSIDLVVTSPPYPMIEMWDDILANQNSSIRIAFNNNEPRKAFELMHQELDKVWAECWRVLKDGSFMCINIGDATRTINGVFALYNNTRIIQTCENLGFINLPNILWKKTTNAPNKFMGSGMLPCGAYVTLEHEWILIFRKGGKRVYKDNREKKVRRDSSFFWEERNIWFSDIWEINVVKQSIDKAFSRVRNASFPAEVPYRLINMYSQKGDIVLDPFMGLGTTAYASIVCERNSIGYEIDMQLKPLLQERLGSVNIAKANKLIYERYNKHLSFVKKRTDMGKEVKYVNDKIEAKVMTAQETDLVFHYIKDVVQDSEVPYLCFSSSYYEDRKLSDMLWG